MHCLTIFFFFYCIPLLYYYINLNSSLISCLYSEGIYIFRALMRAEYFLFDHYTTSIVAPGALSTLVTSVLYSLTRATLMKPGKGETRVCECIRSEFIYWALWKTLMRAEYFLLVYHTTSMSKLSTWPFEHSSDASCSLLVNLSHTHESWEGRLSTVLQLSTVDFRLSYFQSILWWFL